ncbi:hypothetical protein [Kribbella sp. CA-293567]|uniref:hypothetical protein n=1 Tax=Kribbella sp. CA-293567 TaxID=3002436 RepID=UPI0022DE642D|nr:hypothetical protein [Kribbella sp. CA-293567]WBQ04822.1 hypothetical protein OX958_33295 [Kribbella sp. CA-293567]
MIAFVTAPESTDRGASPEILVTTGESDDLVEPTSIGTGISVSVDLAGPHHWRSVSIARWDEADPALLDSLIGSAARQRLAGLREELRAAGGTRREFELSSALAAPSVWLRVAVLDALDRWLHLELDQALLDAERGVARSQAAATLPHGPLRARLVGEALTIAREAAIGLSAQLSTLADTASAVPADLFSGLGRLVNGYATLAREVASGPEKELAGVAKAWQRLKGQVSIAHRPGGSFLNGAAINGAATRPPTDSRALTSLVDPRQLRARLVGPGAEIRQELVSGESGQGVLVTVPAFGRRLPSAIITDRLLVRLVDSKSGQVHQPALLNLMTGREAALLGFDVPVFARVLPLPSTSPEHLRADIFDADSERTPARADSDSGLLGALRAVSTLRTKRIAAAAAGLDGGPGEPLVAELAAVHAQAG